MEFEKEHLKRKNDESKDSLKSKYLKNQIFQLDLELSQVTDEDDKRDLKRYAMFTSKNCKKTRNVV